MQKEVPRRSSAQAKQIKEHLLSEECRKRFLTELDRSASEGQVSQKQHLLSEENGKGDRKEAEY